MSPRSQARRGQLLVPRTTTHKPQPPQIAKKSFLTRRLCILILFWCLIEPNPFAFVLMVHSGAVLPRSEWTNPSPTFNRMSTITNYRGLETLGRVISRDIRRCFHVIYLKSGSFETCLKRFAASLLSKIRRCSAVLGAWGDVAICSLTSSPAIIELHAEIQ